MSWITYPAIDLINGKAVRLYQGDYNRLVEYGDGIEVAGKWQRRGAKYLHIVDLEGAKTGEPKQTQIIKQILATVKIPIQVGGGIRNIDAINHYLEMGVSRIILGTAALENKDLLKKAIDMNREAIAVGLDARNGYVATHGWLKDSQVSAIELGKEMAEYGVRTFIYTDIARDGTLTGPNIQGTKLFAEQTKAKVIASGGISTVSDIEDLRGIEKDGVIGAVVGKALYNGNIKLEDIV